jgi:CRISPR-associated endonuclease/helicase Cas3
MGGLDALIQSAGRCNREGHLQIGKLVIFESPTQPPIGQLRTATDETRALFSAEPELDIFNPETYRRFDKRLDRIQDRKGIQNLRAALAFQDVAKEFKMINDSWQATLIVPWGPSHNRNESLDILARAEHSDDPKFIRWIARKLQRYSVSIPRRLANFWLEKGILYMVQDMFLALRPEYCHLYTEDYGLVVSKEAPVADPSALIG